MKPKITIITPSYNQGCYIDDAIRSVLECGYENLEYIVVDGGSADGAIDVINRYRKSIDVVIIEPDDGQADAINKALSIATGKYFGWINSDDVLLPGALDVVADAFESNPNALIVAGYTEYFRGKQDNIEQSARMKVDVSKHGKIVGISVVQQSTFFRLRSVVAAGGVDKSLNYVFDYELIMALLLGSDKSEIVFVEEVLARYREHSQSKSSNSWNEFLRELAYLHSAALTRSVRTIALIFGMQAMMRQSRMFLENDCISRDTYALSVTKAEMRKRYYRYVVKKLQVVKMMRSIKSKCAYESGR